MMHFIENRKNRIYLRYLLIVAIAGFLLLTVFVVLAPASVFDQKFSAVVQEHRTLFLDKVMLSISWFGEREVSALMAIAVGLILILLNYKREAVFVLLTLVSGVVSSVIKYLVNRPRPSSRLVQVIGVRIKQSFPSGHVCFYVVFFGFLIFLMYRLYQLNSWIRIAVSIVSIFLICTISVSRVYLGVHWLTDVIGGYLIGGLLLYLVIYCYLNVTSIKLRKWL